MHGGLPRVARDFQRFEREKEKYGTDCWFYSTVEYPPVKLCGGGGGGSGRCTEGGSCRGILNLIDILINLSQKSNCSDHRH